MDPDESVNLYNEEFRHGSEIPTSIKRECDYFIKYLHPHGFKFRDVYNNCSNSNQLGLKSGGIRRRTGRYIENTLRNKAYASSFRLPHQVSSSEAPQASSALNRLKEIYPHRFQDQATMPSSHDYNDHDYDDEMMMMMILHPLPYLVVPSLHPKPRHLFLVMPISLPCLGP